MSAVENMESVNMSSLKGLPIHTEDQISPSSTWELDMPWNSFSASPNRKPTVAAESLSAKLSSRTKKSVEEISEESSRRMEHAEEARAARLAEEASRLQMEHEKAAAARHRIYSEAQVEAEEVRKRQEKKEEHAEEIRKAHATQEAQRLTKERERAEGVRQRQKEEAVHGEKPQEEAAQGEMTRITEETLLPTAAADAQHLIPQFTGPDLSGKDLTWTEEKVLQIDPLSWSTPTKPKKGESSSSVSPEGQAMHAKLSARKRKPVEEIAAEATRRMEQAAAQKSALEAAETARLGRDRERGQAVRDRLVADTNSQDQETKRKQSAAAELRKRRAAEADTRLKRQQERRQQAKGRQAAAVRTFGDAKLDDDDKINLLQHVKSNNVNAIKALLDSGDLDRLRNYQNHHGDSALILAAWYGHTEIVEQLLFVNADPNLINCDGNPAINCAAYRGHLELVNLLIDEEAEVDMPDSVTGKTALIKAAYSGHADVCEALLDAGAEVDCADDQGYTGLAFAASFGHREVMKVLLQAGAETNMQDQFGITPLIHAAARGDSFGVCALLEYGARADVLDVEGKTALHYAESNGFHAIVEELALSEVSMPADRSYEDAAMEKMTTQVMTPRIAGNATSRSGNVTQRLDGGLTQRMTPRTPVIAQPEAKLSTGLTPRGMPPPRAPLSRMNKNMGTEEVAARIANSKPVAITVAKMADFAKKGEDLASLKYLTKKLFNLSLLLDQETRSSDHIYPKF